MDLLGIATEIENKFKEKKLVDRHLGSGFCFIDNSLCYAKYFVFD